MKVLALCGSYRDTVQIWRELHSLREVELWLLVCNNTQSAKVKFFLSFVSHFLRLPLKDKLLTLCLLAKRRLHLSLVKVHDPKVLSWIHKRNFDVGLHRMGVIYRETLISLFRYGIINPHIGLLPQYRGRSVMEWSILYGSPTGITAFFIDSGVDTGRQLICWREVDVKGFRDIKSAKTYLFSLDVSMFKEALERIREKGLLGINEISEGKRYYVMSSLLTSVVEDIFRGNQHGSSKDAQ